VIISSPGDPSEYARVHRWWRIAGSRRNGVDSTARPTVAAQGEQDTGAAVKLLGWSRTAEAVAPHAAGRSEQGPVRSQNQDACLVDPAAGLFAVADGIGGHRAGDVAAGLAVEHLPAALGRARRRGRS